MQGRGFEFPSLPSFARRSGDVFLPARFSKILALDLVARKAAEAVRSALETADLFAEIRAGAAQAG